MRALVRGEDTLAVLGVQELDEEVVVLGPFLDGVAEHGLDLRARVDVRAERRRAGRCTRTAAAARRASESGLADARVARGCRIVVVPLHHRCKRSSVGAERDDPSIGVRRSRPRLGSPDGRVSGERERLSWVEFGEARARSRTAGRRRRLRARPRALGRSRRDARRRRARIRTRRQERLDDERRVLHRRRGAARRAR